jgi:hypothetical protein
MTKPICVKWSVGRDRHDRDVTLTWRNGAFELKAEASSQRDEGEKMDSITASTLIAAGEIAKAFKP